jgi:hypothetical protein
MITYRATVDAPGELAQFTGKLLVTERHRRGTPKAAGRGHAPELHEPMEWAAWGTDVMCRQAMPSQRWMTGRCTAPMMLLVTPAAQAPSPAAAGMLLSMRLAPGPIRKGSGNRCGNPR